MDALKLFAEIIICLHIVSTFVLQNFEAKVSDQDSDTLLHRVRRKVTYKDVHLWTDGIIPYVVHGKCIVTSKNYCSTWRMPIKTWYINKKTIVLNINEFHKLNMNPYSPTGSRRMTSVIIRPGCISAFTDAWFSWGFEMKPF